VVSNAGGVNPQACVAALLQAARDQGLEISVATVTGDDFTDRMEDVQMLGVQEMTTGHSLPESVHSMNAYLGGFPIAEALSLGADVVVTGRCVDSALTLGPLIHQFQWREDDFDLLAAGSLAGHLVECGAQATGGIYTDWRHVQGWDKMGFPVVECGSDGVFTVSKPPNTGGLVTWGSVAEQLVYEIGDPTNYLLPDVSCDFSQVTMEEIAESNGESAVLVSGVKGNPAPDTYKVSATYGDGYRCIGVCTVVGPKAVEKAHRVAEAILSRSASASTTVSSDSAIENTVNCFTNGIKKRKQIGKGDCIAIFCSSAMLLYMCTCTAEDLCLQNSQNFAEDWATRLHSDSCPRGGIWVQLHPRS
jgi:hypothetical protein